MPPSVSVLMPVFNSARFVRRSVSAVLDQKYESFELLVLDGGSDDGSLQIIESFADDRLTLHKECGSLVESLNYGIKIAEGDYIARADADTIPQPGWLAKCTEFLRNNPDYAAVGTQAKRIHVSGSNDNFISSEPENYEDIISELFWTNPMIHPTMVLRKGSLISIGGYRHEHWEDYDMVVRISNKYKIANLPDVLVHDYVHDDSIVGSTSPIKSSIASLKCSMTALKIHKNSLIEIVLIAILRFVYELPSVIYQIFSGSDITY